MPKLYRRSAAEWSELISEFRTCGETERQFCQRRGLSFHTFRKWKYRQRVDEPTSSGAPPGAKH